MLSEEFYMACSGKVCVNASLRGSRPEHILEVCKHEPTSSMDEMQAVSSTRETVTAAQGLRIKSSSEACAMSQPQLLSAGNLHAVSASALHVLRVSNSIPSVVYLELSAHLKHAFQTGLMAESQSATHATIDTSMSALLMHMQTPSSLE